MENETKQQEAKPVETTSVAETESPITKAENLLKKIEEANVRQAELLARQEKVYANLLLSGRSNAGTAPEAPKEETPKEYADRILKGK